MNVAQLKPRWQTPACRREAKDRLPDAAVFVLWEKLTDRPATELQLRPRVTLLVTTIRQKLGVSRSEQNPKSHFYSYTRLI